MPFDRRLSSSEASAFRRGTGVRDIPRTMGMLHVEYPAVECEHNVFLPDRSSEVIYGWDNIHSDGASWSSLAGEFSRFS
jgi:hypothetical protein